MYKDYAFISKPINILAQYTTIIMALLNDIEANIQLLHFSFS